MSRYEELSKAYRGSSDKYWAYIAECEAFCEKFTTGLISYLQCPKSAVETFILQENDKLAKRTIGAGEIEVDGFFTSILDIAVPLGDNKKPDFDFQVQLAIKKINGTTTRLRLESFGEKWEKDVVGATDQDAYAWVANTGIKGFEKQLDTLLNKPQGYRIGFQSQQR